MVRLGVAALGKGAAIPCEPRLDPNHPWGSERCLSHVRVSKETVMLSRQNRGSAQARRRARTIAVWARRLAIAFFRQPRRMVAWIAG